MSKYSFDIKDASGMMETLRENYQEFLEDLLSSRKAINCSVLAYHISEWIYDE
jgi:hypothetical protein